MLDQEHGGLARRTGCLPVSISNRTQPSEYRSEAGVGAAERICSGAMYSGVPTIMFWPVMRASCSMRATPKSRTLTKSRSPAPAAEMDVAGLDVAVHDAELVGARRARARPAARCAARAAARAGPSPCSSSSELALEVLHHHVDDAVFGLAEVGDVDDVLVVDLVGGARLAEEALAQPLVLGQRRVQELERDVATDELVARAVHRAHAARAEQLLDQVAARDDACR